MKFTISTPRESCTNAKAKYSSSVVPPDPSVHFDHWPYLYMYTVYYTEFYCTIWQNVGVADASIQCTGNCCSNCRAGKTVSSRIERVNDNSSHVLRGLLPPPSMATQQYSLRRRPHDRQMPDHTGHLADKNFFIRMLYKDSY